MFFVWLLATSSCFSLCYGIAIDNSVQNVQLECSETQISLSVVTVKPLFQPARIFVKGKSRDRNCMIQYPGDGASQRLVFQLPLSSCGMERAGRQGALRGATFMVTYVVSFHSVFITKVDRAYRLICRYGGGSTDLTAGLSVSMIPTQPLEGFIGMADCSYTVHRGASTSPPVRYANVGDKIYHVWECRNLRPSQYMWVHDCYVSPEFGNGELIIDSNGCTRDPVVIGELDYGRHPFHYVLGSHHAYKFADYPTLLWRCSISVCDSANPAQNCRLPDGRPLRVPPLCGRLRFSRDVDSSEISQVLIVPQAANSSEFGTNSNINVFDVVTDPLEILNPAESQIPSATQQETEQSDLELKPQRHVIFEFSESHVCMPQVSFAMLICSIGLLLLIISVFVYYVLHKRTCHGSKLLFG